MFIFDSRLNRYLLKELFLPFGVSIAFLTFIFLMTQILEITNLIVNYKIGLVIILKMLMFSMPFFLEFIIPMSVMMAVLLTFLKMSSDNEIMALKAAGVSIYRLVPPVLLFCLLGAAATAYMAIVGLPTGRLAVKDILYQVASENINIGLKSRTFNTRFKNVMMYVNQIDLGRNQLIDIFIEDRREANMIITVVAPRGQMVADADRQSFHLLLQNGIINRVDLEDRSASTISFATYDFRLDLSRVMRAARGGPKDEEEMNLTELKTYLANASEKNDQYYLTLMEFHKKFAMPCACLALGVLAIPLGIQSRSAKRSFGIGLGLFFFLLYYVLLSVGWVFGEAGIYPPSIGMWLPNAVMGAIGWLLLIMTAREYQLGIGALLFKRRQRRRRQNRQRVVAD
jgi:lipopolysaccharide export system permease protein